MKLSHFQSFVFVIQHTLHSNLPALVVVLPALIAVELATFTALDISQDQIYSLFLKLDDLENWQLCIRSHWYEANNKSIVLAKALRD